MCGYRRRGTLPVHVVRYKRHVKHERAKLGSEQEENVEEDVNRILGQHQLKREIRCNVTLTLNY